ncbi:hypothetical protein K3728_01995 [Rhodobacteraceae bacterium M385]|nr:hypothetical protein K3728_01995 [Rhodobacteraceae bacterium M385]
MLDATYASLLLPFLGTLTGGAIPVILGFVFYRGQKKVDREEQLHAERREVYRSHLSNLGALSLEAFGAEHGDDPVIKRETHLSYTNSRSLLVLYANNDIADLEDRAFKYAMSPKEVPRNAFIEARSDLVKAMKKHLGT